MASLLSVVAGTDRETANIIFFRIASADSRNKIIEKLFQKKFAERYNLFRNSLIKQLGPIDRERNEVVHWNVVNVVSADVSGNTVSSLLLTPPAHWIPNSTTPQKDSRDLIMFAIKCDFYTRFINMFCAIVGTLVGQLPQDIIDEWEAIFSSPIVFPPPEGHPLKAESPTGGAHAFVIT